MKTLEKILVVTVLATCGYMAVLPLTLAQTEPAPQAEAPQATQTAPVPATAEAQATAIVGQAIQGFLLYAPTTEAQRKLAIDSYNTVKAAMDRLAALEKPATEAPTP